jgi:copper homeostasis protein
MSLLRAIPMKPVVEICVDRLDSVKHCAQAGIDRIELCSALSEGGLSPSCGFLRAARQIFTGKIMMMIRPRAGDFHYSPAEQALMIDEIAIAREHGADGVVFGCLEPDGRIDRTSTRLLVQAASGMDITFHRAFDVSHDLPSSLESLIDLGIPRVLSSGGKANVWKGINSIHRLIKQAAGRITILPGGGLTTARAEEFLRHSGATEIHLSARGSFPSLMTHRRDDIPMGATTITGEFIHKIADLEQLRILMTL